MKLVQSEIMYELLTTFMNIIRMSAFACRINCVQSNVAAAAYNYLYMQYLLIHLLQVYMHLQLSKYIVKTANTKNIFETKCTIFV